MIVSSSYRCELRAAPDERVYHAVVPHSLRHVSSKSNGAAHLGLGTAGGVGDHAQDGARDMEQARKVSVCA